MGDHYEAVEQAATSDVQYLRARGHAADGSIFALIRRQPNTSVGSELVRDIPDGDRYRTEGVLVDDVMSIVGDASSPSVTSYPIAFWPDGDDVVLVGFGSPYGPTQLNTLVLVRWSPSAGFSMPEIRLTTNRQPGNRIFLERGGVFKGRYFFTTVDGLLSAPVAGDEPFEKMDLPLAPPDMSSADGRRVTGLVPGGTTHLAWLSRTAPNGRAGFGVVLQVSEDGVVWSAPKEVLVTNAACQLPLTATATCDGAFVFVLGDSRSVAADTCSPDATEAVVVRKPIPFFE